MVVLTGEAFVISLLIIASRAWPTSRSKNNSSYGWISSGDVSHLQASGVIPRNTSTDTPSPRSFDGGATDQTILTNTRQFNTNYMTSRQQERQSNMGSQMNPYQSNINKSPHATERNKQGYDHEIHSTTNEHRINLHQLSREVRISLQHQQHSEGNQNCNQYSGKNCSQIFVKANQSSVSERLTNDRRNSNIVHTTEQYMAVGVHENKKTLKQSMLTSQESFPGDNSRKINKQQLSHTNLEELLAHGVISAGQDDFHNDENYVHRALSIPIDHKVQRGSVQNNYNLGALPLLHNNSFNQHLPPRRHNLEFSITMPQTVSRDNQNRSLPDSVSNNKPLQVATSLASPRNEESKLFISEESVMFNPDSEAQSQRSFRHPNITSSAQGRIVSPMSFRIQPYNKVYNETQDPDASGSKIVFPGEMSGNTVIKFKPQVNGPRPPCADGSSFCETTDEYPHDYVRNLLKNEASIGSGFTDFLPIPVGTRIQPDEQHYLCASSFSEWKWEDSSDIVRRGQWSNMRAVTFHLKKAWWTGRNVAIIKEHVVYPKMAQNKDQKWLFVLNEDSYLQGVRIEKCEKQGPCNFSDNFPLGFVTTCQQKYIYRKLLALGEDGNPMSDSFRLPSCCSCLVTRPVPSPRMSEVGKDQTPATSRKRRR